MDQNKKQKLTHEAIHRDEEAAYYGTEEMEILMADPEGAVGQETTAPNRQPLIQYWSFRFTGSKITSDVQLEETLKTAQFIKEYGYQLEKGGKNGVLHYQGAFECEPRQRFERLNTFFQDVFPELIFDGRDYLQKSKSKAADRYAMKEETRERGPWFKGDRFIEIAKDTVFKIEINLRWWQLKIV